MPDEPRVQELLAELLDQHATPEEVCGACPELLSVVRERWRQICQARAQLDVLLPISPHGTISTMPPEELSLPQVPGYEVDAVLGRGGMGVVYRARHLRLGRLVALKMTLAGSYAGPHERERFRREAEAVAALRHPNLVQVYDAGDWAGRPYFTMELIEGGSLAQSLSGTPQPALQAATLLATLAEAVQVAHQGGIIHRDLKPANILLTADGTPKIADFGLARRLEGGAMLTQSGVLMGTPSYMAPEQARGHSRAVGPAVDVYSLGAILYEALTGRPPFRAESAAETIHQLVTQDPVPPSRLNGKVPHSLETVCLMCLRKEPAGRYASAAELAADLRRFLRHEPIMAKPIGPMGRLSHWVRRHPGLAAALSAVAVLLWMLATGSLLAMLYFRDLGIKDRDTALETRRSLYSAEMNLCGQAATSPSGIRRVHDLLVPWQDSKPDIRGWEWFYLYGLCHRDLDTLSVSAAGLWCVAASPDGERLAAAGNDSDIYVFDARSRNLIHRLTGHQARVWAVAWSPNGSQLASACWDGSIKIWDAKTARELRTIRDQNKRLYSVAWNKDATLLAAAGESESVWIWDATTGKLVQRLGVHEAGVRGVAWHPSENRIASAGMDASIRIWNLNDPGNPTIIKGHGNWVNKVAWHPDGIRLASVSNDRKCKIWNTRDGTLVLELAGHSEGVLGICWSSDGRTLATCSEDQTIRIWNTSNDKALAALRGHTRKATSVAWCNGIQQFVSCSDDGTVKFWSAAPRDETPRWHVDGPVNDLAWSPNGLRIAESNGQCPVKLLDPSDLESQIVLGKEWSSHSVSWAAHGKLLASGGYSPTAHVWHVDSGAEVRALPGKVEPIHSVAWSHHSSALAAVDDGGIILVWNADSGALLLTLGDPQHRLGHQAYCYAIAWSPDDRYLASAWNDGTVRVHDVESGEQIWNRCLHGGESTASVAWSIDGKSIASAGGDSMIYICDAATGAKKQTLQGHTSAVLRVAWHPGGDRLASASTDRSVRVWDPMTGKLMLSLMDLSSEMKTVAWSPDGKTLAAGSGDGTIIIYDAVPGFKAAGISNSPR
jgi:WD40 repeat protein/serine/threonine protein kinase